MRRRAKDIGKDAGSENTETTIIAVVPWLAYLIAAVKIIIFYILFKDRYLLILLVQKHIYFL